VYERYLLNKWNSVKIIDDLYPILGKLKSIFVDIRLNLTKINQVLIYFKVINENLTKDYPDFKLI
jgi:hypothetical protein